MDDFILDRLRYYLAVFEHLFLVRYFLCERRTWWRLVL